MNISCSQFEALMHFYINNELKPNLTKAFENHLLICSECREKYNTFKKIIDELRASYNILSNKSTSYSNNSSEKTAINNYISAYADNELDLNENIKLKKIIISKPQVRKKLENIYSLKELLRNSFEKTKPQEDFSNKIIKSVYNERIKPKNKDIVYTLISFIILSIIWVVMLFYSI